MQNQLSTQLGALLTSQRESVWENINNYRDNGSHADEWLRFFKWVLLPISVAITTIFGMAFHIHLLTPYLGVSGAWIAGIVLTVFIEAAKIKVSMWVIRDMAFGLFGQGIAAAGLTLLGIMIMSVAFYWSYYNSTKGVAFLTENIGQEIVERPTVDHREATAEIDARIRETEMTRVAGLSTKWRGTTTWEGQKIARQSLAVQEKQEAQKTMLMEKALKEQEKLDANRDKFISKTAFVLSWLGGKMEVFQLLIILGIVLCMRALWDRMNGKGPQSPTPSASNALQFLSKKAVQTPVNGIPTNATHKTPAQPTVSQCDTGEGSTNKASTDMSPDDVLELATTKIRRDLANLRNENGKPESVGNRLMQIIADLNTKVLLDDFAPQNPSISRKTMDTHIEAQQLLYEKCKVNMKFTHLAAKLSETANSDIEGKYYRSAGGSILQYQ